MTMNCPEPCHFNFCLPTMCVVSGRYSQGKLKHDSHAIGEVCSEVMSSLVVLGKGCALCGAMQAHQVIISAS